MSAELTLNALEQALWARRVTEGLIHHSDPPKQYLSIRYTERLCENTNAPEDRLNDLVDYLLNNVKVIWLTAASDANAFVIFETLNDRGLELATSDLLKNYIFSLAGDRLGEVQKHWIGMTSTWSGFLTTTR